jgi:hypothetical protein
MKILITFFPIDDMGGIINHHEQLCAGLQELGHEVTTKLLMWRPTAPRSVAGGNDDYGHSGLLYDQRKGFSWTSDNIIPYQGSENLARWKEYASGFDLIIWQVAVPTKRAENAGNTDWIGLYNCDVPQVAVIHDGNFLDSYPWLHLVGNRLTGLACVHTCAFNSARHINVPSALILNPFDISNPAPIDKESFQARRPGFLSVQTFKAWKRVPELCAAIPYMGNIAKVLAGKGIDYYYLTSKDKCKYPGIWDAALEAGMDYVGVVSNSWRDATLRKVTTLIDASWSKKYGAIGAHFNRVMVDAILQGAVPIARDLGIGGSPDDLFQAGRNCFTVPWNSTPQEFGEAVGYLANMSWGVYEEVTHNGRQLLRKFERKAIAQRFIDLGMGDLCEQRGVLSEDVKVKGYQALQHFFAGV